MTLLTQNTRIWGSGCKIFKHVSDFEISTFEIGYIWNFAEIRKSLDFWSKIAKFQHLGSKFSKTNVRSKPKINTFVIGYRQNFVKFRKLIHFDPKCQYLEIWARNFKKQCQIWNGNLRNRVQATWNIEKLILLGPKTQIWGFGLEVLKTKAKRKFRIFPILKIWLVLGCFTIFWGSLWLVSGCFGWFWLVSGCFGSFRI